MINQEYDIHIRHLHQALTHELVLGIGHAVYKFDQKTFIKPHIDINTELRKNSKNDFVRLMINSVLGKL